MTAREQVKKHRVANDRGLSLKMSGINDEDER
jgi:hypothetical protein